MRTNSTQYALQDPPLIALWLALQVTGGHIGIPVMLATIYFSRLRRLPTLYNLMLTWLVGSIVCTMLYYVGGNQNPTPPYGLCLAQATMMNGVPLMGSLSAFALVYEGWVIVRGRESLLGGKPQFRRQMVLLAIPWIGFIAAAVPAFIMGYLHPETVARRRMFYCTLAPSAVTDTSGTVAGIFLSITVFYGAIVGSRLRRNWREFKRRVSDASMPEAAIHSPYLAIRISIYGICVLLSLTLIIFCVAGNRAPPLDILFATIPLTVCVIFGTQEDMIRVWLSLWPSCLVPRFITSWIHTTEDPHSPVLPTRNPSVTQNSFDVWRENYLENRPERPMNAHLAPSFYTLDSQTAAGSQRSSWTNYSVSHALPV